MSSDTTIPIPSADSHNMTALDNKAERRALVEAVPLKCPYPISAGKEECCANNSFLPKQKTGHLLMAGVKGYSIPTFFCHYPRDFFTHRKIIDAYY